MNVALSTDLSIAIQLLIGLITLRGIYYKVPPQHEILIDILKLETIVQFVELGFYIFLLRKMTTTNMATVRYFDWVITTPTMLLTTIIYLRYLHDKTSFTFSDFVKEKKNDIIYIVFCNFMMLLFGYLGEIKAIDKWYSFYMGFIFFVLAFKRIYDNYAVHSEEGKRLFSFIASVWSLYGFAFILEPSSKNISFNILDIFAKNFFGLYLYNKVVQVKQS
jgi:bacteriorhodopsin